MNKMSHTPGTWITDGSSHVQTEYTPPDGHRPFFHTIAHTDFPLVHPSQQSANARLIAAAPELLAALEMFVEEWPKRGSDNDVDVAFTLAKLAIAKASGGK